MSKIIKSKQKIILFARIILVTAVFVILGASLLNCLDKAAAAKIIIAIFFALCFLWP